MAAVARENKSGLRYDAPCLIAPCPVEVTMPISEPMTMASDYALAALALLLARPLLKVGRAASRRPARLWGFALVATAAGALWGGTSHGFALQLGETGLAALWKLTVWSIGAASALMLTGSMVAVLDGRLRRVLLTIVALKLAVYFVWMAFHDPFVYVIVEYAPNMAAVAGLHAYARRAGGHQAAPWMIGGVAVSFAAAGIQQSGWVFHEYFNYNDLYHLVQMAALYLFYRGAGLLREAG